MEGDYFVIGNQLIDHAAHPWKEIQAMLFSISMFCVLWKPITTPCCSDSHCWSGGVVGRPCYDWLWQEGWKECPNQAEGPTLAGLFDSITKQNIELIPPINLLPFPEDGPTWSTSNGGTTTDLLPYELCVATDSLLHWWRQGAGWHLGSMEDWVPWLAKHQNQPKPCTLEPQNLRLKSDVVSRNHITIYRRMDKVKIFWTLIYDQKNDPLPPNI